MVEISIALQTDKPLAAYGPLARQVEDLGFDGVSVYNDMLYQPAWLPLLEIARATSRVRLGPAAANPFTCHPVHLAGNLALLDQASGGRAYLGLARGAWLDFVGLAPPEPVAAVSEAFAAVRHLLHRDRAALPGGHFPLAGGDTLRFDVLRRDVPFLLGSWGPKMIAACRGVVDEIKLGGTANPGAVRWLRGQLGAGGPRIVIGAVTVVDEDGAAAQELARRETALYLPVVARLDPSLALDPELLAGIEAAAAVYDYERAAGLISDELLAAFAFAGTPEEVAGQALAVIDAGAGRVEFGTPHGLAPQNGIRLLGERVLPVLRGV